MSRATKKGRRGVFREKTISIGLQLVKMARERKMIIDFYLMIIRKEKLTTLNDQKFFIFSTIIKRFEKLSQNERKCDLIMYI